MMRRATPIEKGMLAGMENFRGHLITAGQALNKGGRTSPVSPTGLRVITNRLRRSTTVARPLSQGVFVRGGIDIGAPYANRHISTKAVPGKRVTMENEWSRYLKSGEFHRVFEEVASREIRSVEVSGG